MNKRIMTLLLCLLPCCRGTSDAALNFDREARILQQQLNDTNFDFYHEKHPALLEVAFTLPHDFRSERELASGVFVYRLRVEETGAIAYRAIRPAPAWLNASIEAVLRKLKFKPAWIAQKNFASEVDVLFQVEYEAH